MSEGVQPQDLYILAFPHSGSSILKSILGHSPQIFEFPFESNSITDEMRRQSKLKGCSFTMVKTVIYHPLLEVPGKKILIIRDPHFSMSSIQKRFSKTIVSLPSIAHDFKSWERFAQVFLEKQSVPDVFCLRYEDMFLDGLSNLFRWLGVELKPEFINNQKFTNVIVKDTVIDRVLSPPDNSVLENHALYRTWQINQEFTNMNVTEKLSLGQTLKSQIKESKEAKHLGYAPLSVIEFPHEGHVKLMYKTWPRHDAFIVRPYAEANLRDIAAWCISSFGPFHILDAGAYVGDNVLPWAKHFQESFVYAIDPCPENCAFIEQMSSLNGIKNVKVMSMALSEKPTKLHYNGSLNHCRFDRKGRKELLSTSLDHLWKSGEISEIGFIHLDVEGMELSVIKGAKKLIDQFLPLIIFESHINQDKFLGELYQTLKEKKYTTFMMVEVLEGCAPDCRNFLAVPPQNLDKFLSTFPFWSMVQPFEDASIPILSKFPY